MVGFGNWFEMRGMLWKLELEALRADGEYKRGEGAGIEEEEANVYAKRRYRGEQKLCEPSETKIEARIFLKLILVAMHA